MASRKLDRRQCHFIARELRWRSAVVATAISVRAPVAILTDSGPRSHTARFDLARVSAVRSPAALAPAPPVDAGCNKAGIAAAPGRIQESILVNQSRTDSHACILQGGASRSASIVQFVSSHRAQVSHGNSSKVNLNRYGKSNRALVRQDCQAQRHVYFNRSTLGRRQMKKLILIAAATVAIYGTGAWAADSNTSSITQAGDSNSASVDQTGASTSNSGTINQNGTGNSGTILQNVGSFSDNASTVSIGNSNTAAITQTNTFHGTAAVNQNGNNNQATITQEPSAGGGSPFSDGSKAYINQTYNNNVGTIDQQGSYNAYAAINQTTITGTAAINQVGAGNSTANIKQDNAFFTHATINQYALSNTASIDQSSPTGLPFSDYSTAIINQYSASNTGTTQQWSAYSSFANIEQGGGGGHNALINQAAGSYLTAYIYQYGFASGESGGETASIYQTGNSNLGVISQYGSGDVAKISQAGTSNTSHVTQYGTGNNATVTQSGAWNDGTILQNGVGNQAGITQSGVGTGSTINTALLSQAGNSNVASIAQSGGGGNHAVIHQ
jgi:hypothetical protein